MVKDLYAGRQDDRLVYRKALRKPVDNYTRSTPPHVKAVELLDPGSRRGLIRYPPTWTSCSAPAASSACFKTIFLESCLEMAFNVGESMRRKIMGISKRYSAARLLPVLLILGLLAFLAVSCQNPSGPASGTVTVQLSGAGAHEGKTFMFGIYKEGADPLGGGVADAIGVAAINGGAAQCLALDGTLTNIVTFPGGGRYFVFAFVDEDDEGDPDPGEWAYDGSGTIFGSASIFTVNGNMTQTLNFASFAQLP